MSSKKESPCDSSDSLDVLVDQLPNVKLGGKIDIYQLEGFWFDRHLLDAAVSFKSQFEARDDDIIVASFVKTGTTWLKAICTSIMHRQRSKDILEEGSPHIHVPTIESLIFSGNPCSIIAGMDSPRLVHTHFPYSFFPDAAKNSKCKVVYVTRNPKDTFVAWWHFANAISQYSHFPIELAFECFCSGVFHYGPFFEHVLQYWNESLKMPPGKVLFLKYEDLKADPEGQVKKLASFLDQPLTEQEVADVVWRCSIDRLKSLEVNSKGSIPWSGIPNNSFFRRGVVGDSKNYLTPEMEERLNQLAAHKFEGSGLNFDA